MNQSLRIITPTDWKTSLWSGGKTSEIAIFPADADYASRQFLWRLSSATVENETSDFTPLPGFSRFISTLDAPICLTHDASKLTLYPGSIHFFAGGEETHSQGRCSDFNLIFDPDSCEAMVQALSFTASTIVALDTLYGICGNAPSSGVSHDGVKQTCEAAAPQVATESVQYILFIKEGDCTIGDTKLQKHDTLVLTEICGQMLQTDTMCDVFAIRIQHRN